MTTIRLVERTGAFAENKDVARALRVDELMPALERGEEVVLDFEGVDAATQSFVHALISEALRRFGGGVLDRLLFRSCNEPVRKMIGIVTEYMQEGLGPGE
jgi:hypothetical protein